MEFLLKIILFFFVLSLLARLFFRYVLPWWLKRFVTRQQEKFNRQYHDNYSRQREEETYIRNRSGNGKINPDVGEYIDFEEIDDNNDNKES